MGSGSNRGQEPEYQPEDSYHYHHAAPPRTARRRPAPPRTRPRRKRRSWPALLAGCGLGIVATVVLAIAAVLFFVIRLPQQNGLGIPGLGNPKTFTRDSSTQVPLTTISSIQICNKIGNVSVKVDPNANGVTVQHTKMVKAATQAEAEQEFTRMAVEIQPPNNLSNALTCTKRQTPSTQTTSLATPTTSGSNPDNALIVNVTMPNTTNFLQASSHAVDITVKLPQAALPASGSFMQLDVEDAIGDIAMDGLSGVFNLRGGAGNVKVEHAILADNSHLETRQGDVLFNGLIEISKNANQSFRYFMQSEQGNLNVTLSGNPNVTLDANTNVGAIHSDFPINVNNNGGPVNYHGPLDPTVGTALGASLILDVSTGNIKINQAVA
ncbi:MAG: hypothetical protein E6J34_06175 [Chloroflexi bacterium]|nr:MAG: hypothetical protein E6J34_06175 [Chloroflexota bacterium]